MILELSNFIKIYINPSLKEKNYEFKIIITY